MTRWPSLLLGSGLDVLVLGIESASAEVGVALGGEDGILASAQSSRDRRHAENLAPQIQFVCEQAQVELAEVGCIAIDIGPGLFTGLRVGLSSAMALAHGLDVPMIGVSSLELGAFAARHASRTILSCYDARRGEVFSARFAGGDDGLEQLSDARVSTPEELAADVEASGEEVLMVGDGGKRYHDVFSPLTNVTFAGAGLWYPSVRSLVELAYPKALAGETVSPGEIEPMYLRLPDAEINWKTRDGR